MASLLNDVLGVMNKAMKDPEEDNTQPEILTLDKLSKLYWMSAGQLECIYGHGRRKVQLDDDPMVYKKLYWFSEDQLQAIFGGKTPKE